MLSFQSRHKPPPLSFRCSWPREKQFPRGDSRCNSRIERAGRGITMKRVPLSEAKDDLSKYLHLAEKKEVIITRHGKPTGEATL